MLSGENKTSETDRERFATALLLAIAYAASLGGIATLIGTPPNALLAAFLAKKAEFDTLLAELTQASADHFGADPEEVLWGEAAWLSDATAKLKDIADQHFRRGEYAC